MVIMCPHIPFPLLTPHSLPGKTIPYLNKDTKTYVKSTRQDQVQVKIEPKEHSNSAFSFDEPDEHSAKRACVAPSMG